MRKSTGTPRASEADERALAKRRRRLVLRTWLVFAVTVAACMAALQRWRDPIFDRVSPWTAQVTAVALSLLGHAGVADGTMVSSTLYTIEVINECTAVMPLVLFLAAVLSFPCRWLPKLYGALLGLPIIVLINVVRLVSLFYIGHYWPDLFETAHLVVWQSLMVFFAMLTWLIWANTLARERQHDARPA